MYRQSMPRILKRNFHVNLQQEAKHQNRHYANTTTTNNINLKRSNPFKIHMIGGTEYDALKQIRMVQLPSLLHPNPKTLAYTYVKRNIIFGTTRISSSPLSLVSSQDPMTQHDDGGDDDDDYNNTILIPILQRALEEASKEGDQPQGLATLYGLCQYVKYTLDHPETSLVMQSLLQESNQKDEGSVIYHAVKAVATLIPRQEGIQNLPDHLGKDDSTSTSTTNNNMITPISPSNSTIGWGTYLDARGGWTKLAKEYGVLSKEHDIFKRISSESGNRRISEPQLFQQLGGVLIHVEYIGQDENPEYWKDAGGSMARFFFL